MPFLGMAIPVPVADSVTEPGFNLTLAEPVFSKASGLYYKWQWQNLRLSVFLETLEAFPVNIKTLLKAVTKSVVQPVFDEASGLY